MAYSYDVIHRAQQRLAQAKADRESEYRQHLRLAYEKVPQLREIDNALSYTMAQAARAAFSAGENAKDAMEQVRIANQQLQQQRRELLALFQPGYLDDSPICRVCGGLGYVGSSMCDCLQELCRQEQKRELSLLTEENQRFENFRLDYYSNQVSNQYGASPRDIMERNFQVCRRYADNFNANSGNLLFIGNTGLGKTFLGGCIAAAVADKGFSVAYESAANLFAKLEKDRFSPDEETHRAVEKLNRCQLLIIDDLGTELPGNFVTAALYALINDRLLAQKPMVISTNLNVDEISRRYSPQIASRMQGSFKRLTFVGEDIRVLKNRGEKR